MNCQANATRRASGFRYGTAAVVSLSLLFAGAISITSRAAVIAHWSFDSINGSNQFEDDSGNNYHATIAVPDMTTGSELKLDASDKVFGAGAANFDRASEVSDQNNGTAEDGDPALHAGAYARAPHISGFHTVSHTVAAWVKVTAQTSWSALLGDWSDNGAAERAYIYGFTGGTDNSATSEKPMFALTSASGVSSNINFNAASTPDFTKDEWHHVAWVVDRVSTTQSDLSIYVDGNPTPFKTGTFPNNATNADIRETANETWIGLKEDNGIDLHARVDEMWIFDEALSIGAIQSLMNNNQIPEPASALLLLGSSMIMAVGFRPRRRTD